MARNSKRVANRIAVNSTVSASLRVHGAEVARPASAAAPSPAPTRPRLTTPPPCPTPSSPAPQPRNRRRPAGPR